MAIKIPDPPRTITGTGRDNLSGVGPYAGRTLWTDPYDVLRNADSNFDQAVREARAVLAAPPQTDMARLMAGSVVSNVRRVSRVRKNQRGRASIARRLIRPGAIDASTQAARPKTRDTGVYSPNPYNSRLPGRLPPGIRGPLASRGDIAGAVGVIIQATEDERRLQRRSARDAASRTSGGILGRGITGATRSAAPRPAAGGSGTGGTARIPGIASEIRLPPGVVSAPNAPPASPPGTPRAREPRPTGRPNVPYTLGAANFPTVQTDPWADLKNALSPRAARVRSPRAAPQAFAQLAPESSRAPAPPRSDPQPAVQQQTAANPQLLTTASRGRGSDSGKKDCCCKPRKVKFSCGNPLLSRSVTKDGVITIKRKLQCPPSKSKSR